MLVTGTTAFIGVSGQASPSASSRVEAWTLSLEGKLTRIASLDVPSDALFFKDFGGMVAVQLASGVELLDATDPSKLHVIGTRPNGCDPNFPDFGDGFFSRGLWLPDGIFGITHVSTFSE